MKWIAIALAALLGMAGAAQAQTNDAAGRWAARSNGRPVMIVTLSHDAAGWHGTWQRPTHFGSDMTFSTIEHAEGPAVERALIAATEQGDGLDLRFEGAPGKDAQMFHFTVGATGVARLSSPDMPGAALVLDRAQPGEAVIDYDADARYPIDQHWPTSPEMTAIFEADQGDRGAGQGIDWSVVGPRDEARRSETKRLLDSGALHSGEDFYHAAFVFQHGATPGDYLLAHALATVAIARGKAGATWIAAATLDRYLQQIGQPQVYGTQFSSRQDKVDGKPTGPLHMTQAPYDRTLISDALRTATGVPAQADQEKQRAEFEAQFQAAQRK
ncbi:MAG TPA: hypothetical protein VM657_03595 [Sphingomonas sp.]|nr:hypothetical protein [Sphingomonas sp.]